MKLNEAIRIIENMCFRYGKAEQNGRSEQQIKEVMALNIVLNKAKELEKLKKGD